MKTLVITDGHYYDVFSFDESYEGVLIYPSLTDFVNRSLMPQHSENYEVHTIYTDDVYDEAELDAIRYLTSAIPEQRDPVAISAFFMLYDCEDSYLGLQLD